MIRSRLRPSSFRAYTLLEVIVSLALSIIILGLIFAFLVPTMRVASRSETRLEMQEQAMVVLARIATDLGRSTEAGLSLDDGSLARTAPATPVPPMLADSPNPLPTNVPTSVTLVLQELPEPGDTCVPPPIVGCSQSWSTHLVGYCWDNQTQKIFRKDYNGKTFTGTDGTGINSDYPQRLLSSEVDAVQLAQPCTDANLYDQELLATDVVYFVVTMASWGPSGPPAPNPANPNGFGYVVEPINIHIGMLRYTASGMRVPETFCIQRWLSSRNTFPNAPGGPPPP